MLQENTQDVVQYIISHWNAFDKNLDTSGTEIVGRIVRLNSIISQIVDKNFEQYQLTVGEFDVLAALIREPEKTLTPKQIQSLVLISSGGLTNRIDRLEKKGFIQRIPNPQDRRSWLINLTLEGERLVKKVAPTHLNIEKELISSLPEKKYNELRNLLVTLVNNLEPIIQK